jgi:3-phenylpropionate/cinnamic acid dioxygenase small subunit
MYSGISASADEHGRINARSTWSCHMMVLRTRTQHTFFGASEYALLYVDGQLRIQKKKISLMNDDIPAVLDIYCL